MDPISAKLTESALRNVGQLSTPGSAGTYQVDQSSFGRLLDTQMSVDQTTNTKLLELVENLGNESVAPPINAISGSEVHVDVARAGEIDNISTSKGNIFDIFKEVNDTQMNMDGIMETLTQGNRKFTTQEMIRLQILAHVNTVNMEVVSKVGEMANKAISTPFNMQIS